MEKQTQSLGLLALGANLPSWIGSPVATLRHVLENISNENIGLMAVSQFWETPAFPAGSGPNYVNAAAVITTTLGPHDLLAQLHSIEAGLGRQRDGGRWQARGVDIDLLALDDQVLPDAGEQDRWRALPPERQAQEVPGELILPHPRIQDRAFVLEPLCEVAPHWRHPRIGLTVAEMRDALPAEALAGMKLLGEAGGSA